MEAKLANYKQYLTLMSTISSHQQISQLEKLIIMVHSINLFNGIKCLDEDDNICEFPINWNENKEGVYRLKYKLTTGKFQGKVVQFSFVNLNEELSVNFVVEDSDSLNSVTLKIGSKIQQSIKTYEEELNKITKSQQEKIKTENTTQRRPFLQPVPLRTDDPIEPHQRPVPLLMQPGGLPLTNPFGRQEYVGPNSQIFNGRGGQIPRIPQGHHRPPGARYDPVDPFGLQDNSNNNFDQFSGFNQWGVPKQQNPFNRPFGGGNGGGFGSGGFGGFF